MNEEKLSTAVITVVLVMLVITLVVANLVRYGCCTGTAYKMPIDRKLPAPSPQPEPEPESDEPIIEPIPPLTPPEDVEEKLASSPSSTTYIYAHGVVAEFDGSELRYYHQDYLGSTRVVTNEEAEVVYYQNYMPFGEQIIDNEDFVDYTGKKLDEETELYYFGARYYDADTGRFTQLDPIQTIGSNYVYAADNPYKFTDPNGEEIQGGEWTEEHAWRDVYHYTQFLFWSDADWETQKGRYILENIGVGFLNLAVSVNNLLSTTSTGIHMGGAVFGFSPEETDLILAFAGMQSYLYPELVEGAMQYSRAAVGVATSNLKTKVGLASAEPQGLTAAEYAKLNEITSSQLDDLGLSQSRAYISGSAAEGVSHNTGLPFGPGSDIDLNIVGPDAWKLVKPNKVFKAVTVKGEHIMTWQNPAPALTPMRMNLAEALNYPVNVKVFRTQQAYNMYVARYRGHLVPVGIGVR